MCGIAGIVSFDGVNDRDRATVNAMLDTLHHRGPDGRGTWSDRRAVIGHTRLSIIDVAGGAQPLLNEDETICASVNGEIYNHALLRSDLESRGHRFRTGSDCEVVVHLYEEYGRSFVDRLRGMFAIAVWDARKRSLLLARDPFGIKPLYYARMGSTILFASQLNAIMIDPRLERTIDPRALHEYLTFHYIPSPRTILRSASKLGPTQCAVFTAETSHVREYRDIQLAPDDDVGLSHDDGVEPCRDGSCSPGRDSSHVGSQVGQPDDDAYLDALSSALRDTVSHHTLSDVPIGAFLSGGLDSGAIVATLANTSPAAIRTFTVGFEQDAFDERVSARAVADLFSTMHHDESVEPDPHEITTLFERYFDEPFGDPSAIPTYYASRLAARSVKVVLSGDGGDEWFGGYTRYQKLYRRRAARTITANPWARSIINGVAPLFGSRVSRAASHMTADHDLAHCLSVAWFNPLDTLALLNRDARRSLQGFDPFAVLRRQFDRCDSTDPLARSQFVDLKTWLADGVLCKVDRASMACSLEVRVPLLDTQWASFASRIPTRLKLNGHDSKIALRRAMEPFLGNNVTQRRKRGFEVPLDDWFRGPLADRFRDTVLQPDARINEWLDPDAIRNTWQRFQHHRGNLGARLWALMMLENWLDANRSPATSIETSGVRSTAGRGEPSDAQPTKSPIAQSAVLSIESSDESSKNPSTGISA
jgi:asparagine synthase (glutamine-hydrolysing)